MLTILSRYSQYITGCPTLDLIGYISLPLLHNSLNFSLFLPVDIFVSHFCHILVPLAKIRQTPFFSICLQQLPFLYYIQVYLLPLAIFPSPFQYFAINITIPATRHIILPLAMIPITLLFYTHSWIFLLIEFY